MASSLDMDVGRAPSRPAVIKVLTIDATAVTSYLAGGFADAELTAALEGLTDASAQPCTAHSVRELMD